MNARPAWRSRTVPIVVAVAVVVMLAMFTVGASGPAARVVPIAIIAGAAGAVVWAFWKRRAERRAYESRLTEWAAGEAILAERLRIARDLHDLVSHGLGLITVRSAATRHLPQTPEVREALTDIEETSRHATAELRRMLTVLREPSAAAPRTPAEGLTDLPSIVRDATASGIRPSLTLGDLGAVSPGVQVALCRTVREGLSNAARHAGPVPVRVDVHRDGPYLVASIADGGADPAWRPSPGAGHGLIGLRERITSLGGTLTATPVDGGFRLAARIPDEAPA